MGGIARNRLANCGTTASASAGFRDLRGGGGSRRPRRDFEEERPARRMVVRAPPLFKSRARLEESTKLLALCSPQQEADGGRDYHGDSQKKRHTLLETANQLAAFRGVEHVGLARGAVGQGFRDNSQAGQSATQSQEQFSHWVHSLLPHPEDSRRMRAASIAIRKNSTEPVARMPRTIIKTNPSLS